METLLKGLESRPSPGNWPVKQQEGIVTLSPGEPKISVLKGTEQKYTLCVKLTFGIESKMPIRELTAPNTKIQKWPALWREANVKMSLKKGFEGQKIKSRGKEG